MRDNRPIRKMYSKEQGKMITIPSDIRPTIEAYKAFKRPAFAGANKGEIASEKIKRTNMG